MPREVLLYDARGEPLVVQGEPDEDVRADAWQNWQTGIGTPGDKTTAGRFFPVLRLFDSELRDLYNGSDLAAKIVEKRPKEMLRRGFKLKADEVKESDVKDLREHATEVLRLEDQLLEAAIWGRLFGGDLLLLGCDDGGFPWEPLDEQRIRTFGYLNQVDRRYAYAQTYYSDPLSPKYGLPETYLIISGVGNLRTGPNLPKPAMSQILKNGWQATIIHETRCIRFDGNPVEIQSRQQLAGWTWSVLQRVYNIVRGFDHAFDSTNYLLSDAAQAVLKLHGLMAAISAGRRQEVAARVALIEETRSVARAVLLDAATNEEFERHETPLSGVADILDRWMARLAAAADMPQTELFGAAPKGLNATGESDTRKWYDTIATEQTQILGPKISRLFRLMCLSDDCPIGKKDVKFEVTFLPLWSPTDGELADTRQKNAQRDVAYIQEGVVTPEEVALGLTEIYPSLDVEAREQAMKGAQKFDPYENEPEPQTSAAIAGRGMGQQQGPSAPVPLPGAPEAAGTFAKTKGGRLDDGSRVQAVVFTKGHFSRDTARAWCEANGHDAASIRETQKTYRARQVDPARFKPGSLCTVDLAPGVQAIVGKAKR